MTRVFCSDSSRSVCARVFVCDLFDAVTEEDKVDTAEAELGDD